MSDDIPTRSTFQKPPTYDFAFFGEKDGRGGVIATIMADGEVVVNPKFNVTEAAKVFWDAVTKMGVASAREHEAEIARLRKALVMAKLDRVVWDEPSSGCVMIPHLCVDKRNAAIDEALKGGA